MQLDDVVEVQQPLSQPVNACRQRHQNNGSEKIPFYQTSTRQRRNSCGSRQVQLR
jgi:hypothetical protein